MLEKLVEHMHWANATVIEWIGKRAKPSDDLIRLTSHILNAECVWINRANRAPGDRDTFKVHGFDGMRALNASNRQGFARLLQSDLDHLIDYALFDGSPGRTTAGDMIIHAFSHGFHHVGQMAAAVSASREKFPNVSYIGFTRSR